MNLYVWLRSARSNSKGQSAIQAARKDLGDYVSQAQQGLNKQLATLSVSSPAPASDSAPSASASTTDAEEPTASSSRDTIDSTTPTDGKSSASSSTSALTATLPDNLQQQQQQQQEEEQSQLPPPTGDSQTQTLFSRLQSSLPPDLLGTLRETIPIPDSVRDPQARMDLAHAAQARMQDAAARGEELLRGASVFLRDAVRVVPPSDLTASASSSSSVFTVTPASVSVSAAPRAAHANEDAARQSSVAVAPAAHTRATSRRGALLRGLRANPAILRVDPAKEGPSVALFTSWVKSVAAEATRDESSRRESELAADDGILESTRSILGACSPSPPSPNLFFFFFPFW